jgi:hypothetical protein
MNSHRGILLFNLNHNRAIRRRRYFFKLPADTPETGITNKTKIKQSRTMYNRLLLTLGLCAASLCPALAQTGDSNIPPTPDTARYGYIVPYKIGLGVKANVMLGSFSSAHLKDLAADMMAASPKISKFNISVSPDFSYGLGLTMENRLAGRLFLTTELSYNFFSSKFNIDYAETDPTVFDSARQMTIRQGQAHDVKTEVQLHSGLLQIPIMLKYNILPRQQLYVLAGASANFMSSTKISGLEEETTRNWINDTANASSQAEDLSAVVDKHSSLLWDLVFGIGTSRPLNGNAFHIDFRYYLPLTKTEFSTTDPDFAGTPNSKASLFFQETFKQKLAQQYPAHPLNDFKLGMIGFSFTYNLFSE